MKTNMQTLKGFRDFLPSEAKKRQFVAAKIQQVFERFAFVPLMTPTLEYASLLLGKYGDEADKLVYTFTDRGDRQVGLRYDQTVPTARILSQYQNELPKYFRRYQIQNVFRADKPQKGRYREFTQCDCDIFGSTDTLADAELLTTVAAVFQELGFASVRIEINDRRLLIEALSPFTTPEVDVYSIIQSIDKLDKMSPELIIEELNEKGLTRTQAEAVISKLEKIEISSNLSDIVQKTISLGVDPTNLVFNPKLARGLDYYTGLIFEIKIPEVGNTSVGGGGRYDRLIADLADYDMPAVGVGLGFDRIVEACEQLGLLPDQTASATVLVTYFPDDQASLNKALEVTTALRQAQIATELFVSPEKLVKQFKNASAKNIPFVVVIGETELQSNKVTLKDLRSGEQSLLSIAEVISWCYNNPLI